jgi:photosystem II stability/assembly factor-like uncharacterized protein
MCLLALFVNYARAGDGQWTSNGPYGGLVSVLVRDPKTPANLYAAGFSGIYKSSNNGATWSAASSGINDLSVDTIAIDPITPTTLYAGSIEGGPIVKSVDGAQHWTPLSITLVVAIAIDPKTPTTIYASQSQGGLFKSTDGGATWHGLSSSTFPGFPTFKTLTVDPSNTSVVYAGEGIAGIFKSTDGGATWNPSNNGLTGPIVQIVTLAIDQKTPSTLYASANTTGGSGLFKSTDGGANWANIIPDPSTVLDVESVAVDPTNSSNVYVGTFSQGLRRSTNGGTSFTAANSGLPQVGVEAIAIDPLSPNGILIGTQNGIFASSNAAGTWLESDNGLALTTVNSVAVDPKTPTTIYAATKYSGLFKSTDGAGTWTSINTGIGPTGNSAVNTANFTAITIDPTTPTTLYVGAAYTQQSAVYKSTDGGAHWTSAATGIPIYASTTGLAAASSSNIFVTTENQGTYRSTDQGASWSAVNGIPTGVQASNVAVATAAGQQALVAVSTLSEGIFASTDSGATFQLLNISSVSPAAAPSSDRHGVADTVSTPCASYYQNLSISAKPGSKLSDVQIHALCETSGEANGLTLFFGFLPSSDPTNADTSAGRMGGDGHGVTDIDTTAVIWSAPDGDPSKVSACSPVTSVVDDPTDPTGFYVGADCGILNGRQNGHSLTSMSSGLPPGTQIQSLTITPDGATLYAGTQSAGVFAFSKTVSISALNLDQHGLTGVWYNPTTGGQGLLVETYPNLGGSGQGYLAAGWYTFDVTAAGGQRWYTLQGPATSSAASVPADIYAATGGNFNATPKVSASKVGTATLTFSDCATGTLAFNFNDGRTGSIPLTRADANVTCGTAGDNGNAASNYLLSGAWYDPATSGQGFFFAVNPLQNLLFAAWYTYAPNGASLGGGASQRWYTIQDNSFVPGTTSKNGLSIYETTGGVFNSGKVSAGASIGTANIVINSCTSIALSYTFTGGTNSGLSGSINLGRVVGAPNGCSL